MIITLYCIEALRASVELIYGNIPSFRRLRQKDGNKCKVNLGYIVCFGSARIRLQRNRDKNMFERETGSERPLQK